MYKNWELYHCREWNYSKWILFEIELVWKNHWWSKSQGTLPVQPNTAVFWHTQYSGKGGTYRSAATVDLIIFLLLLFSLLLVLNCFQFYPSKFYLLLARYRSTENRDSLWIKASHCRYTIDMEFEYVHVFRWECVVLYMFISNLHDLIDGTTGRSMQFVGRSACFLTKIRLNMAFPVSYHNFCISLSWILWVKS